MKSREGLLLSDIVKTRIDKIITRSFKVNPTLKLSKNSEQKCLQPKKLLMKEFDLEQVTSLERRNYFPKQINKKSSKLYMSHILGMKNIKDLVGVKEIIGLKTRPQKNWMMVNDADCLIKPPSTIVQDFEIKKRCSVVLLPQVKTSLKIPKNGKVRKSASGVDFLEGSKNSKVRKSASGADLLERLNRIE
jgi:hypothetical protein